MNKNDFLVAVKLATGIEIKLGTEYFLGSKIGFIRPIQFMGDGIRYEYYKTKLINSRYGKKKDTAFASYCQLMDCISDIREIIPDKIHHKWMMRP